MRLRRWALEGRQHVNADMVRWWLISIGATVVLGAIVLAALKWPRQVYLAYLLPSLLLGVISATTLPWILHAWRTPESLTDSRIADNGRPTEGVDCSFSLIVPARHEEPVLETTLRGLIASDYPAFEVLVVVGADDQPTRRVAESAAAHRPDLVKVLVDESWPKSKPRALNAALPHCTGSVTGVFDAEDDVQPGLLRRVNICFRRTGADVVQGGVQLMNFRSNWWAVHNVLEYFFWFRSRLHRHARQQFFPLGGNTVFVRTDLLRRCGGWDGDCLAEDCELGVRLSAMGARTAVFYEPEVVTREECPHTLWAFVRQRTRWNQGYLQTLANKHWLRLPLRRRALGLFILGMPFALAASWVVVPVGIAIALTTKIPAPLALLSFLPAVPLLITLVIEVFGLADFCRCYGQHATTRDYCRLVVGMPVYQLVLALAAGRAVARAVRGRISWEKTTHLGAHLRPAKIYSPTRPGQGELALDLDTASTAVATTTVIAASGRWNTATTALAPWHGPGWPGGAFSGHGSDIDPAGNGLGRAGNGHRPAGNGHRPAGNGHRPAGNTHRAAGNTHRAAGNGHRAAGVRSTTNVAQRAGPNLAPRAGPNLRGARSRSGATARLRDALARNRADLTVAAPLVALLSLVQGINMLHFPNAIMDEGSYVANAWAVGTRGDLSFYTYTYGHPPLAWILIALWTVTAGLFGHFTYSLDTARVLMWVLSVAGNALLYVLGRRIGLSRPFAAAAVALFTLSPVALYFHRAVLLDNPATVWMIAAFVLALSPRRRLWSFAASGACCAASVLSKETLLLLVPALLVAAFLNSDRRTRRYCMALLAACFLLLGGLYPLYATIKGELLPGPGHVSLIASDLYQVAGRQGTGSVLNPASPGHSIVMAWLRLDPWLLGTALALTPVALALRRSRAIALAYVIQVLGLLRTGGYLPEMYVIAGLPFAALVVAGSVQALWRLVLSDTPRRRCGRSIWPRIGFRLRYAVAPFLVAVCLASGAAAAAAYAVPHWVQFDWAAMTVREDGPERAAQAWLIAHLGRKQRILVTEDFWIFLIVHGFDSRPVRGGLNSPTVIDFWELDLDPAVKRHLPYGWRELDYVVSTPGMRAVETQVPSTRAALANSRVVASFGTGTQRIEVRRIERTALTLTGAPEGHVRTLWLPRRPHHAGPRHESSLIQVARRLRVSVRDIVLTTDRFRSPPAWWWYLGTHNYHAPLPHGIELHYVPSHNFPHG